MVDLGRGTGRDVFVLAQLVGPDGHVHGVDTTEEQPAVARETAIWHAEYVELHSKVGSAPC